MLAKDKANLVSSVPFLKKTAGGFAILPCFMKPLILEANYDFSE